MFSDLLAYFSSKRLDSESVSVPIQPIDSIAPVAQPSATTTQLHSSSAISEPSALQYENFSKEFQSITQQDNFDGFRLEAGKTATKQLHTSHTLFLGTTLRESGYVYQFGPTFAREDGSLLLVGRYGIDGVVNGRIAKTLAKGLEFKANLNSSLKEEPRNMYELSLDYGNKEWASSLKLAWQGAWLLNGSFSQVITPHLQMGGDLTWIAANGASIGAIGARYSKGANILTCQLSRQPDFKSPIGLTTSQHTGKIQYVRKVTDRLSLATEYEYSPAGLQSGMKVGYEYLFRQARVQGLVDTGGKVSVMAQDFSGFGVSGVIDYWRGDYKFGFMMHVVPQPES